VRGGDEKTTKGSEQICRQRGAWDSRKTSAGVPHLELGITLLSRLTVTAYCCCTIPYGIQKLLLETVDLREKHIYLEGSYKA